VEDFVSQLEQLMPAKELKFKPTPGFGSSYKKFLAHAIAHPAKMNTRLTEFLIKKFTCEGQLILDPMAGSGQTGVIAAVHGRDAVCVDLEEKFHKWMETARKKVECQQTLGVKGKIRNVCGDARKLSRLLKNVDVVVTSPPFGEQQALHRGGGNVAFIRPSKDGKIGTDEKDKCWLLSDNPSNIGNLRHGEIDAVITSPPYTNNNVKPKSEEFWLKAKKMGKRWGSKPPSGTTEKISNPRNIGNLRHGKVDTIITSPPYKTANEGGGLNKNPPKTFRGVLKNHSFKISENPKNIDNLPFGVDAVITSPPYAEAMQERGGTQHKFEQEKKIGVHYSHDKENIGNLKFDVAITSPPYEGILQRDRSKEEWVENSSYRLTEQEKGYQANKENIGNLKKETYLQAMLTVYREMHKVLKPNGKAIIVIKPFIRNKKVVDLPYDTYLLLKQAGFKLTSLFKLRLKNMSFWRILYHKKFANVPQIKHEYVLVTTKFAVLEA